MNVFADFLARVHAAVESLIADGTLPAGLDLSRITVEPPREASHGDIATNAAMVLAKPAGAKPRELAEKIAQIIAKTDYVTATEVAGPGFINLRLADAYWQTSLAALLAAGDDVARLSLGAGEAVNVEYVSANPTGPLHVGHCRGAVFGDALANLLEQAGYKVTREYYINDAGAQIDVLTRSSFLRYREALGEDIGTIPEGLYPGDYLVAVGQRLAKEHGQTLKAKPEADWLPIVRKTAMEEMMTLIRADLAALRINQEVFFSEASLHAGNPSEISRTVAEMRDRNLVYQGTLPPPKGQVPDDWEDREQTLFRASDFGDDVDRPLIKSDGSYTYFAADIAYFRNKFERGFSQMIYVLGADHGGYVKRLEAVAKAVSGGKARAIVRLCQLVNLFRGGEQVKMSKRAGDFITLREVVDEVGPDVVRFMMLFRKNDAPLDFDFIKVTEQSRENPVFYVQYAHARAQSVLRNAADALPALASATDSPHDLDLSGLQDDAELGLIKRLATFQRVLEGAALAHEPHRLAFYLHDVASDFHALWNKGKDSPQLRFINTDDPASSYARIALVRAVALVLSRGLSILGVEAVQEMR